MRLNQDSLKFWFSEDELKYSWSVQDQNQMMHIDDSSSLIQRLEKNIEKLDESGALKCAKFIPISTSASIKVEKILKSKGKIDSIWVGLSVSHYIDDALSQITSEKGVLTVETPLFLLLVGNELLESFKHKVVELGSNAGFRHKSSKDYDILKCYSVTMNK